MGSSVRRWILALQDLRDRIGSYKAVADELRVHENTVLRWVKGWAPDTPHEVSVAALMKWELDDFRALMDEVTKERYREQIALERSLLDERRPPQKKGGGSAAAPLPGNHSSVPEPAVGGRSRGQSRGRRGAADNYRQRKAKAHVEDTESSVKLALSPRYRWPRAA